MPTRGFITPGDCGCCTCRCQETSGVYSARGAQRQVKVEISGLPSSIAITEDVPNIGFFTMFDYDFTGLADANGTHFFDLPTKPGGCLAELEESHSETRTLGTANWDGIRQTFDNPSSCTPGTPAAFLYQGDIRLSVASSGDSMEVRLFIQIPLAATVLSPVIAGCQAMRCQDKFDSDVEFGALNSAGPFSDKPCAGGDIWLRYGKATSPPLVVCGFTITPFSDSVAGTMKASLV